MILRRSVPVLVTAVLATALLAGCGGSDDGTSSTASSATTASGGGGSFPATVSHQFGSTTVPEEPRRIVVVGLNEQDTVLALGYKPIAATEWFGEKPGAIWPWAREAMGPKNPVVLDSSDGVPFEEVAALKPDLIIGTQAGLKQEDYDKLSAIAPTVAGVKGGTEYFSPWDQQAILIAEALGEQEKGEQLVAEIEAEYARVAAEHPEFKGKVATFSQCNWSDSLLYVYPPGLGTEFLSYLGFEINPKLTPLIEVEGEQVTISAERLDVIDADAIVFACDEPNSVPALSKVPTFDKVPAIAEQRAVYTDPTLAGAIYFNSPLSLPYVLEHLTPELARAVKGEAPQRQMPEPKASGATASAAKEGVFPVTIEHKWGSTTIDEAPERVVVAGLREQDALLALDVVPVATTEWFGEHPGAIFPWAKDELGEAPLPEVLDFTDGLQFEKIAAERPDLIVAIYSGLSKEDYEKLSAIAPTIAQPPGQIDWGAAWREETLTVGEAVGKPAEAQRLVDEAEAEIAAVAREHPEFEGKTALVGTFYEGLYAYGPNDARSQLMVDLGFEYPPAMKDFGGDEFGATVPDEEVSKLDVEALVWFAAPKLAEQISSQPVYGDLAVHRDGRDIFIDEKGPFYESTSFISVLSMPTLLKGLAPLLANAVDGDPQTKTDKYS